MIRLCYSVQLQNAAMFFDFSYFIRPFLGLNMFMWLYRYTHIALYIVYSNKLLKLFAFSENCIFIWLKTWASSFFLIPTKWQNYLWQRFIQFLFRFVSWCWVVGFTLAIFVILSNRVVLFLFIFVFSRCLSLSIFLSLVRSVCLSVSVSVKIYS